jgi:plastocyanin
MTERQALPDARAAAPPPRSFYARVCALGFGVLALTGLVVLGFGLAGGDGGDSLGFALAFISVGLLVGGAVWRWGRWALVVAAGLGFVIVGVLGPFSLFPLLHPESAADFVPVVGLLAGGLLGLVGAVVALAQGRRGPARPRGTRGERLAVGGLLGLVTLASLLSLGLTLSGRSVVSAAAKTGATSVQLKNYAFAPNWVPVKAGDRVRLVVKNDDQTLHTFTLPAAGVDVSVPPGSEKIIEFTAPAAGTYQWYCVPHSDANGATRQGMVGTLVAQ